MSQLPLLEKNAYLAIQLTHNSICANLSYSHYDIGRHYVLTDETFFDPLYDDITEQRFWDEYFAELTKVFDWKLVISTNTKASMAQIARFRDEGDGIAGISFIVHDKLPNRVKILSVLHTYIPTAEIVIQSETEVQKYLPDLAHKLGYKNLIHINADMEKFDVTNVDLVTDKGKTTKRVTTAKIHWDNRQSLIESIRDKRIGAFSTIDLTSDQNMNLWANYVNRSVPVTDNSGIHDMLRSFLTVQLTTILKNQPQITLTNNEGPKERLVVIEGLLARVLDDKEIVISILDGFQMKGGFDLLIDENAQFMSFGKKFTEGINSSDYITPISSVLGELRYVAVVEVGGRSSGKAVMMGEIIGRGDQMTDVYVLSSEFREYLLGDINSRNVFTGRGLKGAYVYGNGKKELIVVSDPEERQYKSVFIDARERPVIYGPDHRKNKDKLRVWTNE